MNGGGGRERVRSNKRAYESSSPDAERGAGNRRNRHGDGLGRDRRKRKREGSTGREVRLLTRAADSVDLVPCRLLDSEAPSCQIPGSEVVPRQPHLSWQSDAVSQWLGVGGGRVVSELNRLLAGSNMRFNEGTWTLQRADVSATFSGCWHPVGWLNCNAWEHSRHVQCKY